MRFWNSKVEQDLEIILNIIRKEIGELLDVA